MTTPTTPRQDRGEELPGDVDAPDIVSPVGEEMPVQDHDGVDDDGAGAARAPGTDRPAAEGDPVDDNARRS